MKKERIYIDTITFKLPVDLCENYKKFCNDNSYSLSKRLRFFMEKDMEGLIQIKNKNNIEN